MNCAKQVTIFRSRHIQCGKYGAIKMRNASPQRGDADRRREKYKSEATAQDRISEEFS